MSPQTTRESAGSSRTGSPTTTRDFAAGAQRVASNQTSNPVSATGGTSAQKSTPTSTSNVNSNEIPDSTSAQRVSSSNRNLDPRSQWGRSGGLETTTTTTTEITTTVSTSGGKRQERTDSGISIPDRTVSRGNASLDEAVSRP
jgi:hypothetical protein